MKRMIFVILLCGIIVLSGCKMEEEIQKDTVMVDTLKVSSTVDEEFAVVGEFVEFGYLAGEELMLAAEEAFDRYLDLPAHAEGDFITTTFSNLQFVLEEVKPVDQELLEKIQAAYPRTEKVGYYEVTQNYAQADKVVTGKFENGSNEVLEINNPFWEESKVDDNLSMEEAEAVASAYVAEKGLVGTDAEFALRDKFLFPSSDDEADLLWFRYENLKEPTDQVLVYMRSDARAVLGFYRSYMALQVQAEIEKFATRME